MESATGYIRIGIRRTDAKISTAEKSRNCRMAEFKIEFERPVIAWDKSNLSTLYWPRCIIESYVS